jgi:hypothetical protein
MPRPSCSAIAIVVVALLAQACTGDGSDRQSISANRSDDASALDGASSSGTRITVRSYAPTMTAIYDEVLSLKCAVTFCHFGAAGTTPIMSNKDHTYVQLVGIPASGAKCADAGLAGLLRVDPGHPETSLLYLKVENPPPAGLCGDPMPSGNAPPLEALDIEQIRQWIAQGATNN